MSSYPQKINSASMEEVVRLYRDPFLIIAFSDGHVQCMPSFFTYANDKPQDILQGSYQI
jgi:hypothetical protein